MRRGHCTGVYPPTHGRKSVCDTELIQVLFCENEEQLDKWLNFRNTASPQESHCLGPEGLRHFQDPWS
jgi:hypothetical protein